MPPKVPKRITPMYQTPTTNRQPLPLLLKGVGLRGKKRWLTHLMQRRRGKGEGAPLNHVHGAKEQPQPLGARNEPLINVPTDSNSFVVFHGRNFFDNLIPLFELTSPDLIALTETHSTDCDNPLDMKGVKGVYSNHPWRKKQGGGAHPLESIPHLRKDLLDTRRIPQSQSHNVWPPFIQCRRGLCNSGLGF